MSPWSLVGRQSLETPVGGKGSEMGKGQSLEGVLSSQLHCSCWSLILPGDSGTYIL